jgi:hypothetical protein
MASTFWAVSYFRSLKASSVLNQLTKYLLQYRRVSIPSVGTIQLVQQPATLDVASKLLLPPSFKAEWTDDETVSDHQLRFLSAGLEQETANVRASLQALGLQLSEQVRSEGFHWKGIGLIRQNGDAVPLSLDALEPVAAQRVLRHGAEHNVLVGDQQMTSTQIAELREEGPAAGKRSLFVIVGWIILLLSILYILFVLYKGKFRMGATGSQQAPTSYLLPKEKETMPAFGPFILTTSVS